MQQEEKPQKQSKKSKKQKIKEIEQEETKQESDEKQDVEEEMEGPLAIDSLTEKELAQETSRSCKKLGLIRWRVYCLLHRKI